MTNILFFFVYKKYLCIFFFFVCFYSASYSGCIYKGLFFIFGLL